MKKAIHPKYSHNVKVTCSCGNSFITGSTVDEIFTELCSVCHPFYTGEQKIVDTENMVSKFKDREAKKSSFRSKKQKMQERKEKVAAVVAKPTSGLTLKDMLAQMSGGK